MANLIVSELSKDLLKLYPDIDGFYTPERNTGSMKEQTFATREDLLEGKVQVMLGKFDGWKWNWRVTGEETL